MRRRRQLLYTYLLAGSYAFLLTLPLLTLLSASLRTEAELYTPGLLPPNPTLAPYGEALAKFPLGRYLFNSLLVSTLITLGVLTTSLLAAYALTRLRFPGRELLFGLEVELCPLPPRAQNPGPVAPGHRLLPRGERGHRAA